MNRWLFKLRHRLRSERQYYSPVVNPFDERVRRILDQQPTSELPRSDDLQIDERVLLNAFEYLSSTYREIPFQDEPSVQFRYYYQNPAFSYGDAISLFGMILTHRPKRIIEVGSGFSSCLMMDVNDHFFNGEVDLHFIDPYPQTIERLLRESDERYRSRVIRQPLQDVSLDFFTSLEANDILFIDSSHVTKVGSDVNDYLFRILPALMSGVLVQIHDIPYPFEYPLEWVLDHQKAWNEVYLIHAFLQYNSAFRIEYFNHFMYRHYRPLLAEKMPLCLNNCGASRWLKKT